MKALCISLILATVFTACYRPDNATLNEACAGNCTIVQGRITTTNNLPAEGVTVEVRSIRSTSTYTGVERKIARVTTDADGYYYARFFLNDYESGPGITAQVNVQFKWDENRYIALLDMHKDLMLSSKSAPLFRDKETVVIKNFLKPF